MDTAHKAALMALTSKLIAHNNRVSTTKNTKSLFLSKLSGKLGYV